MTGTREPSGDSGQRAWFTWLLVCIGICAIQLITLNYSPAVIQDEPQIIDFGRVALQPTTDWGMSWDIPNQHPVLPLNYLGPVLQELAYQLSQPSHVGPRLMSLLSALIAASCLLGWLLARGTPRPIAVVLAGVFLIDPVFSETYRMARMDGWAVASCIGSCWLLRWAGNNNSTKPAWPKIFGAGLLLAVDPFIWPVAVMMVPLVVLELYYFLHTSARPGVSWKKSPLIKLIPFFAAGGFVAAFILLIPILSNWPAYLDSLYSVVAVQGRAATIKPSLIGLLAVNDPIIVLVVAISLLIYREYGLLLALCLAVLIMYQSMIYSPRIVYLLPYLLAGIAGAATETWMPGRGGYGKPVMVRALALLLVWNVGEVLIFRTVAAVQQSASSNVNQFLPALQQAVGAGSYRVYLEEWPAYYAGRELGWKMWNAGSPVNDAEFSRFLQTMDFVILAEQPYRNTTLKKMDGLEFQLESTIRFPPSAWTGISVGPINIPAPAMDYRTLLVYRNTK